MYHCFTPCNTLHIPLSLPLSQSLTGSISLFVSLTVLLYYFMYYCFNPLNTVSLSVQQSLYPDYRFGTITLALTITLCITFCITITRCITNRIAITPVTLLLSLHLQLLSVPSFLSLHLYLPVSLTPCIPASPLPVSLSASVCSLQVGVLSFFISNPCHMWPRCV